MIEQTITVPVANNLEWLTVQEWCYDRIGELGSEWDCSMEAGAHGKLITFKFFREQDITAFALRWVK